MTPITYAWVCEACYHATGTELEIAMIGNWRGAPCVVCGQRGVYHVTGGAVEKIRAAKQAKAIGQ